MKNKKSNFFLFCLMLPYFSFAQFLFPGGEVNIDPAQVIIENYSISRLAEDKIGEGRTNFFDRKNPYTGLVLLNDDKKMVYHILFQTNFQGKILYLAFSKNLMVLLEKKNPGMAGMQVCIQKANQQFSAVHVMDEIRNCVISRLPF